MLHDKYVSARNEVIALTELNAERAGVIVPLLGPTRCGKTELLQDLKSTLETRPQSSRLFAESDFVIGRVPPIPNGKSLNASILAALGLRVRQKESTSSVRDRVISTIHSDGIRFLALDECNHLVERGSDLSLRTAADQFKTLVDATGVTLILSGLPRFQTIIDANEQLRDRSTRTVSFLPYNWSLEADRNEFFRAFLSVLNVFAVHSVRVALDDEDCARRVYGVTSGRVGMMLRLFSSIAKRLRQPVLDLATVSEVSHRLFQASRQPEIYFSEQPPTDPTLVRSYTSLLTESGVKFTPGNLLEFSAAVEHA